MTNNNVFFPVKFIHKYQIRLIHWSVFPSPMSSLQRRVTYELILIFNLKKQTSLGLFCSHCRITLLLFYVLKFFFSQRSFGTINGVANAQIWSCYVNFSVFSYCKNNRFLKKWVMLMIWNLHSKIKICGLATSPFVLTLKLRHFQQYFSCPSRIHKEIRRHLFGEVVIY